MLNKIIEILNKNKSSIKIENDIISCTYLIDDLEFLKFLEDKRLIANSIIENYKINEKIDLEFLISKLMSQNFYLSKDSFLEWNCYEYPVEDIYIYEINDFLNNNIFFNERYSTAVKLIGILQQNSKFSYNEDEILNFLFVREDKSLLLHMKYSSENLNLIENSSLDKMKDFIQVLNEDIATDRKNIYINELIEFLLLIEEKDRFSYLLNNFEEYIHRASSAYNYYLRNFSYNKLKIELDTKALEFYQKIQSVINDSQTKLIAIPTSIALASATLDYGKINSVKNYLILTGMVIFSGFIQIFINNQKSALEFIERNIETYKQSFSENKQTLEISFKKVDSEKDKQKHRLLTIQILLWLCPIIIVILLFVVNIKIFLDCIFKLYKLYLLII